MDELNNVIVEFASKDSRWTSQELATAIRAWIDGKMPRDKTHRSKSYTYSEIEIYNQALLDVRKALGVDK